MRYNINIQIQRKGCEQLKKQYSKVTKEDVFNKLICAASDFLNPIRGTISLVELSHFLKTSRYQVKKHVNTLRSEGLIELKCIPNWDEEENYPPYWGYALTDKGRETEAFKNSLFERCKILEECFK